MTACLVNIPPSGREGGGIAIKEGPALQRSGNLELMRDHAYNSVGAAPGHPRHPQILPKFWKLESKGHGNFPVLGSVKFAKRDNFTMISNKLQNKKLFSFL